MTTLDIKRIDWASLDGQGRFDALARPSRRSERDVQDVVSGIFEQVALSGGLAVTQFAERIDGFKPRRIAITPEAVAAARDALPPADTRALRVAAENVRVFHQATKPEDTAFVETTPGVKSKLVWRPIGAAGIYVPGGTAPLFSSLLMQAIPAEVAGVTTRVVVTPPAKDGSVHPAMILAAAEANLDAIWLIGGAQAIAALTYGAVLDDGEIPACDKLFGPGNAYVAEAKRYAAALPNGPSVDMPAGPSELLVIADRFCDPEIAAADLLSQAEHDADAQVILVCERAATIDAILAEVEEQLTTLPRADIARASLSEARAILVSDMAEACAVSNLYGPEHLAIQAEDAEALVASIRAAGAVFVGRWAAETLGDYAAGPSHVLPTDGGARTLGGITTASFMTSMSVQTVTEAGAERLGPIAARLARLEGLEAHARAADLRSVA
ncbi:histidinol dehydrogenase [Brevundimonas subvibrioides]|uniref:Histidinol dehydrogenase n=1 Tax=Brevundimonas subvibrioides (strain ATCC 15264 / DSM 4735 / LMG 14903 / NBRC 16000 / CB 81) TaxID=633149 RepID=D9QNS2_BRESC|nr:histidinol dehydrogenase [Brevundimonas subvibrioides]ADL00355.1 histidinol dehydrogenase [Brevundimonas subvibrioides ATCC 15264]